MSVKLLKKIKNIDPKMTNIKRLVQLSKDSDNPREIEPDSFLDGGVFLLWCLQSNRTYILSYLLGESMVHFWRFA